MKEIIQTTFRKAGFEIRRLSVTSNPFFQLIKAFQKYHVETVLDIGANSGQFAKSLRTMGYSGKIVSFEPLSAPHLELMRNASSDMKWQVHQRCAIGDFNGQIQINVAGNSFSSSILPILNAHTSAESKSAYIAKETVNIQTLDTVAPQYLVDKRRFHIKIDTQGFEWQVLNGASDTLKNACGLTLELSLIPLYAGQRLWREIIDRLGAEGFTLWALQPEFIDPRDGRTLQVDATFFRLSAFE
ncbi:MAG: FkbM family methyltransferase [Desulfamplus sp.]|nr:FkbM family methyltransferase [Desulfamplus sp.]